MPVRIKEPREHLEFIFRELKFDHTWCERLILIAIFPRQSLACWQRTSFRRAPRIIAKFIWSSSSRAHKAFPLITFRYNPRARWDPVVDNEAVRRFANIRTALPFPFDGGRLNGYSNWFWCFLDGIAVGSSIGPHGFERRLVVCVHVCV